MSNPYLGEIRVTGFNFAPRGWALCNGQLLAIAQNQALFAILGTTYGGNGVTTFALPNMQSRMPVHMGQGSGLSPRVLGELDGVETVTLTTSQVPSHNHSLAVNTATATALSPSGAYLSAPKLNSSGAAVNGYAASAGSVVPMASVVGTAGGNQPHDNMPPYTCLNFIIALQGIFPSRN